MKERRREIPFVVLSGDQRTPRAKRLHSATCEEFWSRPRLLRSLSMQTYDIKESLASLERVKS